MAKLLRVLGWGAIAAAGAVSVLVAAVHRGESINALWLVTAGLCTFAISYRFYSKWLTVKVLVLDERRAPPSITQRDGKDFVPTNKWVVYGHHFAAIAGPGPLVGPVLAAQFGYLPGMLWILIGATLGGGVHDAVVLFASMRRCGKSLGQMLKEEVNPVVGLVAMISLLAIMTILLAVLALVVVKALAESPWGLFTIAMTIPLAMTMGVAHTIGRVSVRTVTVFGVTGLLASVWAGGNLQAWGLTPWFDRSGEWIAWALILYGFSASVLPVWLLLAPRDYLSTYMKLGTVAVLAAAVVVVAPPLHMPAVTRFIDGTGLVFAGPVFPFVFITIACGAISGFHALISSGTTPKLADRESIIRSVGYGAMITEMLVALMALVAACALEPGVYFAINAGLSKTLPPAEVVQTITAAGFPVTVPEMSQIAAGIGEKTMFGRTGGAPTFALGMAQMFAKAFGGGWMALWYHFAIMFEALFILTTIDAGTRVGRFILQDFLGYVWKPLGDTRSLARQRPGERAAGVGMGLFPLHGRDRSDGRHQHAVAAVRHRKPVAGGDRVRTGHHRPHQDGPGALCLGDGGPADLPDRRHVLGGDDQDLLARPRARLPRGCPQLCGEDRGRWDARTDRALAADRPHEPGGRRRRRSVSRLRGGDRGGMRARLVSAAHAPQGD